MQLARTSQNYNGICSVAPFFLKHNKIHICNIIHYNIHTFVVCKVTQASSHFENGCTSETEKMEIGDSATPPPWHWVPIGHIPSFFSCDQNNHGMSRVCVTYIHCSLSAQINMCEKRHAVYKLVCVFFHMCDWQISNKPNWSFTANDAIT